MVIEDHEIEFIKTEYELLPQASLNAVIATVKI